MTCRVALSRMHCDGLITLAPSQIPNARRRPHFAPTQASDPQTPLTQPVHERGPLTLRPVTGAAPSRLWNEYLARYHYLGYTPMSGSQIRYYVFAAEQLVALISFGASAWKLAQRERFIGWQEPRRLKNLQLVVNNARFLILPWIESKGLTIERSKPEGAWLLPRGHAIAEKRTAIAWWHDDINENSCNHICCD